MKGLAAVAAALTGLGTEPIARASCASACLPWAWPIRISLQPKGARVHDPEADAMHEVCLAVSSVHFS